ncbi:uncharacterized protein LOC135393418 [Ornithodoros turicata]|uniref:uncharacterized protein LOC135393418 n=1 Tax=Ornithodoros turicata TaxID=34597 RepID=UPI003139A253
MAPKRCVVQGCKSTSGSGHSLHKFPKDPKLRQAWADAVCDMGFVPQDYSLICSRHFPPESYTRLHALSVNCPLPYQRRKLKCDAVPVRRPQVSYEVLAAKRAREVVSEVLDDEEVLQHPPSGGGTRGAPVSAKLSENEDFQQPYDSSSSSLSCLPIQFLQLEDSGLLQGDKPVTVVAEHFGLHPCDVPAASTPSVPECSKPQLNEDSVVPVTPLVEHVPELVLSDGEEALTVIVRSPIAVVRSIGTQTNNATPAEMNDPYCLRLSAALHGGSTTNSSHCLSASDAQNTDTSLGSLSIKQEPIDPTTVTVDTVRITLDAEVGSTHLSLQDTTQIGTVAHVKDDPGDSCDLSSPS